MPEQSKSAQELFCGSNRVDASKEDGRLLLLLLLQLLLVGGGMDQQVPHLVGGGCRWLLKVLWDPQHYLLCRGQGHNLRKDPAVGCFSKARGPVQPGSAEDQRWQFLQFSGGLPMVRCPAA